MSSENARLTAREKLDLPASRMIRLLFDEASEGIPDEPEVHVNIETTPGEFKEMLMFAYEGPPDPEVKWQKLVRYMNRYLRLVQQGCELMEDPDFKMNVQLGKIR